MPKYESWPDCMWEEVVCVRCHVILYFTTSILVVPELYNSGTYQSGLSVCSRDISPEWKNLVHLISLPQFFQQFWYIRKRFCWEQFWYLITRIEVVKYRMTRCQVRLSLIRNTYWFDNFIRLLQIRYFDSI